METKTVNRENKTGKWKDTGLYWKYRGKLYYFERAVNTVYYCLASCFPDDSRMLKSEECIGKYAYAIGEASKGAFYEDEDAMMKGKQRISREDFVKMWNVQTMSLPNMMEV